MEQTLNLSNTTLVVTLRCNLKCKFCAVLAPYYSVPPHYPLEELTKTISNYFKVVDKVEKFTINGGEPLLHPHLPEIVDFLASYIDKIGLLEILTNGTAVPCERLLKSLRFSNKVDILVDDYGQNISTKIPQIIDAFKSAGIKYRHRKYYGEDTHCGGWVDLLDLSKKERSASETERIYKHCAYPGPFHCLAIFGHKAYICGIYKRLESIGVIPDTSCECIDFANDSISINEKKDQIRNFYNRPFFSACAYCNGFCGDSERFAPAEQLKQEFINKESST